ncbi:MAG: polysaccharide biosynthesis C-terminal domain-containing protein, partial [Bacteroidota bacterium]
SAPILAVLICGFVPMATAYVFGTLLTANGSLRVLNQLAFAGVLLNIVLNCILISYWNAFGAAVASFATQLLVALGQLVVVRNVFQFRVNYRLLATMLGLVVTVALAGYGLQFTGWRWEWQAGVLIGTAVALAFAWRILSIRALAMLLKYG